MEGRIMSTRGTAFFEIQESPSSKPGIVGRIGIPRDGYPKGFGYEICAIISSVRIDSCTESPIEQQLKQHCYRNVDRAVLHILYKYPSDYFFEDEYVYRFIIAPYKTENTSYRLEEVMHVEVKHNRRRKEFDGSFGEFRIFCDRSD